ncbi:MAG TPA: bifunctional DNA-formamidopyrimidine glycosylase/DNA-(apurinic or apyrimidinic site) lyase [Usitatibacteraceae bacterium]|nr:bifunctional DNA-formamidopyrimidine glycosylase/DNA-(apurinic or apyrimidinic site) lyase [Usitatibacteraceae bacterium]
MPELPEVETTRLGLLPAVRGKAIAGVTVRSRKLRWPVPENLPRILRGQTIRDIARRGKYLLWQCDRGFLLVHLGMSGSLCVESESRQPGKHDHVLVALSSGATIRYNDPRRFGAILWIPGMSRAHPLLDSLGPEPLGEEFSAEHLYRESRGRTLAVKPFIMDAKVVVGVGNIYASEALFHAGIHPATAAGRISRARYARLAEAIRRTLASAIAAGGSSLRNYVHADGAPGYFQLATHCYDREGEPCRVCNAPIRTLRQGQRSTFFCPRCQK